jgi:hypothetical protein
MSRPNQYSSEKRRKELEKKKKKEEKLLRKAELKNHPEGADPEAAEEGAEHEEGAEDGPEGDTESGAGDATDK